LYILSHFLHYPLTCSGTVLVSLPNQDVHLQAHFQQPHKWATQECAQKWTPKEILTTHFQKEEVPITPEHRHLSCMDPANL